jgi:hypothetical protein
MRFHDRISVEEAQYGWSYVLLDNRHTGLFIRWTDYDSRAEIRDMSGEWPLSLGEYPDRHAALSAAIDLLEFG